MAADATKTASRTKSLVDSPFSIDRLFVWALGIVMLAGMFGMVVISLVGGTIPPQLQSAVMFCIGVFAARIERSAAKP